MGVTVTQERGHGSSHWCPLGLRDMGVVSLMSFGAEGHVDSVTGVPVGFGTWDWCYPRSIPGLSRVCPRSVPALSPLSRCSSALRPPGGAALAEALTQRKRKRSWLLFRAGGAAAAAGEAPGAAIRGHPKPSGAIPGRRGLCEAAAGSGRGLGWPGTRRGLRDGASSGRGGSSASFICAFLKHY